MNITEQERYNLKEIISRYKAWVLRDISSPYAKSKFEWVTEVKNKIRELEEKLKHK